MIVMSDKLFIKIDTICNKNNFDLSEEMEQYLIKTRYWNGVCADYQIMIFFKQGLCSRATINGASGLVWVEINTKYLELREIPNMNTNNW